MPETTARGRLRPASWAAVLTSVLLLAGCGGAATGSGGSTVSQGADRTTTVPLAHASQGDLRLTDGWVAAPTSSSGTAMAGMQPGATTVAYAALADSGPVADTLVSVGSSAARRARLHDDVSSADGSADTMEAVSGITVPAGGRVVLAPGGYHVMLTGLLRSLKPGDTMEMTWTFRSGAVLHTTMPVISREDRPGS